MGYSRKSGREWGGAGGEKAMRFEKLSLLTLFHLFLYRVQRPTFISFCFCIQIYSNTSTHTHMVNIIRTKKQTFIHNLSTIHRCRAISQFFAFFHMFFGISCENGEKGKWNGIEHWQQTRNREQKLCICFEMRLTHVSHSETKQTVVHYSRY